LSALRHILLQLKNKEDFVSYRNSKLTMLLQDAIGITNMHILKLNSTTFLISYSITGGNAKTLLIICVNPSFSCAQESKCSLVFGERANAVELGKAKQNIKKTPDNDNQQSIITKKSNIPRLNKAYVHL